MRTLKLRYSKSYEAAVYGFLIPIAGKILRIQARQNIYFNTKVHYTTKEGGFMIYEFKGIAGAESVCDYLVYTFNDLTYVVFTELNENKGTSITNVIEQLATEVYTEQLQLTAVEDVTFVEHYEWPGDEHYDIVALDWDGEKFVHPKWRRVKPEEIGLWSN
jgi:hypothetical protein